MKTNIKENLKFREELLKNFPPTKKRVSFHISSKLKDEIDKSAKKHGFTNSEFLERVMRIGLDNLKKEEDVQE